MSERRTSWSKGLFGLASAVGLFFAAAMPSTGCVTEEIPGDECVGGVVVDGQCQAKCDPAKCLEGNVCVDNQCKLLCGSHEDCFPGFQVCRGKQTDADANGFQQNVQVCDDSGQIPTVDANGFPAGWHGLACPFGDVQCEAQLACPNGVPCTLTPSCGDCELDAAACGDDPRCNKGKCASTGEACLFNTCGAQECQPLRCVNFVSEGDATAYCSKFTCATDDECQPGFYCGTDRDPLDICGEDSAFQDGLCGVSTEACVEAVALPPNFSQGTVCTMRNSCLKREACSPCATNLDCSVGGDGMVCAQHAGDNVCAELCDTDLNCRPDEQCVPYAPSTAKEAGSNATCGFDRTIDCIDPVVDCPVPGDTCVPRNVCVPRSGKCDGSDIQGSKFCAHCVRDTDCGPPGSSWICDEDNNGDRVCFDRSFPDACTTDADCPVSPSGKNGHCIDASDPFPANLQGRCYFPERAAPLQGSFACFDK